MTGRRTWRLLGAAALAAGAWALAGGAAGAETTAGASPPGAEVAAADAAELAPWAKPGVAIPVTSGPQPVLRPSGASASRAPWAPPGVDIPVTSGPQPILRPEPEPAPAAPAPAPAPVVEVPAPPVAVDAPAPPAASGVGRRIVYSNSRQRVWLYEADGRLVHSHLVSGRRGVPRPGVYSVFSKSRVSRSGSVRLDHMVRFARGKRLAIGFHAIPVGRRGPIQSVRELGQFRSAGCVRQAPADAQRVWEFAPIGTRVVVTA